MSNNKIIFSAPFNALSFGQVSYNIARELFRKKIDALIFPSGEVDIGAFNPKDDFVAWLKDGLARARKEYTRNIPSLRLWHINGAESRISDRQVLFTFHETDEPTNEEVNIVNNQDFTFFSSTYSKNNFELFGAKNIDNVALGFDEDIKTDSNRKMSPAITHWLLVGKWEMRKNTALIIKTWIRKYGNNPSHALTLLVFNPFLHRANPQAHAGLFNSVFDGKPKPFNVNIFNPLQTNEEVNQTYNSADIDLSGFSNAEGWGLPSFNMTGLGKWSIVTDCSAHRDWATLENSILVKPNGKQPVYDGVHFSKGQPFNQGNFFLFDENQLSRAMDTAETKAKIENIEGLKLREKFTYSQTVDKLLSKIL